tara:strand:- start:31 stop:1125 length:1095 start_codon:yes stop_codon:yes gene_type:complete
MKFRIIAFIILSYFFSLNAHAFEETGASTVDISKYGSFEENKKKIIEDASFSACLNVLDKYTGTFSTARLTNYEKVQSDIESNLSSYVECSSPIDENLDIATNEYSVVIKGKVNTNKIDKAMQDVAAVNNSDEPSEIVILLYTRTLESVKKKDDKVTKIEQNSTSVDVDQTEASSETETSISSSNTETTKSVTGGNTVSSSESVKYKVSNDNTESITAGMEDILNEAGFELVPAFEFAELDDIQPAIMEAYALESDIPNELKRAVSTLMKDEEIPYYIDGIFDVGREEVDPATGLTVVGVSLTKATTYYRKEGKRRFKSIATVSGVQRKGKGTNPEEAINNALDLVSKEVAQLMVDKINAKGVQ